MATCFAVAPTAPVVRMPLTPCPLPLINLVTNPFLSRAAFNPPTCMPPGERRRAIETAQAMVAPTRLWAFAAKRELHLREAVRLHVPDCRVRMLLRSVGTRPNPKRAGRTYVSHAIGGGRATAAGPQRQGQLRVSFVRISAKRLRRKSSERVAHGHTAFPHSASLTAVRTPTPSPRRAASSSRPKTFSDLSAILLKSRRWPCLPRSLGSAAAHLPRGPL